MSEVVHMAAKYNGELRARCGSGDPTDNRVWKITCPDCLDACKVDLEQRTSKDLESKMEDAMEEVFSQWEKGCDKICLDAITEQIEKINEVQGA